MSYGKRKSKYPKSKYDRKQVEKGKLLNDLQSSLHDLNCPYLLIHNTYGGLTKLSIYS